MMDPELLEQIDRAANMTGEQKLRECLQLYDRTRRMMLDGLRGERPGADRAEIERLYRNRLMLNRAMEVLEWTP